MLNNIIKYYKNVSNGAMTSLRDGKKYQFRKMLTNKSLLQSTLSHYEKFSRSNEAYNLMKEYTTKIQGMYKLAQKDYNSYLNRIKNTKDLTEKQTILNDFANNGITGFIAKNGAKWNIETYSNMLATHFNNQMVRLNVFESGDKNSIFRVSEHTGACDLCKPYEGLTGTRDEIEKMEGLFHVRCKHFIVKISE